MCLRTAARKPLTALAMPIEPATLLAFVIASIAVYVTPGVDMAYIASNSIARGVRGGLWAAAGTVVGVSTQAFLAAFGVTAAFAASPVVFEAIRWAGVAYLAYLGIRLLISKEDLELQGGAKDWSPSSAVLKGMTINLLNPKVMLFFAAFLPQFVDPQSGPVLPQLAALGAVFSAGSILWCAFLAVFIGRVGSRIRTSPTFLSWQRRVTGTAFIGFAGLLAAADLRR